MQFKYADRFSDFVDNEGGHTKWRALFIHMNNEKISPCLVTMKVETGVNFFFGLGKNTGNGVR